MRKTVYEVETHFIGDAEYYYFDNKQDAEKAVKELNSSPGENAYFGIVKNIAYLNEILLNENQYIEGNEIITINKPYIKGVKI